MSRLKALRALNELAQNAEAWAHAVVRLTDGLLKQGVPLPEARQAAVLAASITAQSQKPEDPLMDELLNGGDDV